jgi:zinc protease
VRFPSIAREELANGMRVWSIQDRAVPMATAFLIVERGSAHDPSDRPGLAGVTADMLDEAAGGRSAIELADAFGRLGMGLGIDAGSDVTTLGFIGLARCFAPALALLADVALRPALEAADLARVRELRLSRLRQLKSTPGAGADRAFLWAVFGAHAYGHGVLGTTASLQSTTVDDVRRAYQRSFAPSQTSLIVSGDLDHADVMREARQLFESWHGWAPTPIAPTEAPVLAAVADVAPPVLLIDRPGAPQSELRVGHDAPARRTDVYPRLVTLNALLGGQFSSRINHNLREVRAITYSARTSFDLRRLAGSFACETSVQADATGTAVEEILREFAAVRQPAAIGPDELARAKASLTRGYVRNFETAEQLARAASLLLVHGLADDTFDQFVPIVEAIGADAITAAAREFVRPEACAVVVSGDAAACRLQLEKLGRPVVDLQPEF